MSNLREAAQPYVGNLLGVVRTAIAQAQRIIAGDGDKADIAQDRRDLIDTLRVIEHAVTPEGKAQPVAWLTPELDRVITEKTMAGARSDGGAILSSLRSYTVPAYTALLPPAPTFEQFCKKYGLDPDQMDGGGGMWARVAIEDWTSAVRAPELSVMVQPVAQVVEDLEAIPFRKVAWLGQDLPVGTNLYATPHSPAEQPDKAQPSTTFEDHRVQKVYEILCSDDAPSIQAEHWEGYRARQIVDALFDDKAQPVAREGWKLVPVDPTADMLYEIQENCHILPPRGRRIWAQLLEAAPQAPAEHGLELQVEYERGRKAGITQVYDAMLNSEQGPKRPENCGTNHCSCIECPYEPGAELSDEQSQIEFLKGRLGYWESHLLEMNHEQGVASVILVCASLLANKDAADRAARGGTA